MFGGICKSAAGPVDFTIGDIKRFFDIVRIAPSVARTNIDTAYKALEKARENWCITKRQCTQQRVTSSDKPTPRRMTSLGEPERAVEQM